MCLLVVLSFNKKLSLLKAVFTPDPPLCLVESQNTLSVKAEFREALTAKRESTNAIYNPERKNGS